MMRGSSPFGWSSGYSESLRSSVTALDDASSDLGLSRPSAKSIYNQRKEYASSMSKHMHQFHHKVEHLFTFELDGQELCDVNDCLERLKYLDAMGRVWGQDVLLEVQNGVLLLADIETKEILESWPLSSILDLKAVLDERVYDSLLAVSIQERSSRPVSIFLFQSESVRADYLKKELERLLGNKKDDHRLTNGSNVTQKNSRRESPPPQLILQKPPETWDAPDYDESPVPTPPISRNNSPYLKVETPPPHEEEPQRPYTERERNVDILNHLINDIEAFADQLTAVAPKMDKKKKKKKHKSAKGMPTEEQFSICLRKIKMAFNLLGKLHGKINNPTAAELVHCLFSILELVVFHCNENLPPSIVAPLFEPECVIFLSEEATPEEDQLWQSLGDAWNIPSTKWPEDDDDIPTYTPVFDDGWEPPDIRDLEPSVPKIYAKLNKGKQEPAGKREPASKQAPVTNQMSNKPPQEPKDSSEELPASYLRAVFDFTARNPRELTISKGEQLQLLDMSKQWWKVKNERGQVGYVPNNMLQPPQQQDKPEAPSAPTLTRKSRPEEVRAWLEHKGFSKITVRCLGGISGSMLLGMTRDELKTVCPEEGGRVFNQLQNVKSALAANEVRPMI